LSGTSPTLLPVSSVSKIILPSTGSTANVTTSMPFGVYTDTASTLYSSDFISGAADQVAYTYWKMVGNGLDIELSEYNIYAAYEEATLEYSYHLNLHQAKNSLGDSLGASTGTFDHDGNIKSGSLSSSLNGSHVALKFPQYSFTYSKRVGVGISQAQGLNGNITEYSGSVTTTPNVQDYDLQELISAQAEFSGNVGNKRIIINQVFYKAPRAAWRFYGYYGGLTTVGNFHNYGQWADDSMFEIIPVWHNKLQAMQYENAIYTRLSHYSYELKNNKLRIYPAPSPIEPGQIWIRFYIPTDAWDTEGTLDVGQDGVNNVNTLPYGNLPYGNINSIGKQWIRDYAFFIAMEQLGFIRSKFNTIPIPGESVTLNGNELISRAKEEKDRLRTELKDILDELTYQKLAERDAAIAEDAGKVISRIPMPIYVG
jgi:hypothetical protein